MDQLKERVNEEARRDCDGDMVETFVVENGFHGYLESRKGGDGHA